MESEFMADSKDNDNNTTGNFYYKIRCSKHAFAPYTYCEMCMIRTQLQDGIEVNRKTVQDACSSTNLAINVIHDILDKLQDHKNRQIDENRKSSRRIDELESEIKELKRFQDVTHQQYQFIINRKHPHKCPVCEGKGKLFPDKPEVGMVWDLKTNNQVCDPCEGKGIVWG
jgi:septal ring factor EnvC (AmiA/AmiB activator)